MWRATHSKNKLAKARKMRKPPGTLGLKKFGLGRPQNILIDFLAKVLNSKKIHIFFSFVCLTSSTSAMGPKKSPLNASGGSLITCSIFTHLKTQLY